MYCKYCSKNPQERGYPVSEHVHLTIKTPLKCQSLVMYCTAAHSFCLLRRRSCWYFSIISDQDYHIIMWLTVVINHFKTFYDTLFRDWANESKQHLLTPVVESECFMFSLRFFKKNNQRLRVFRGVLFLLFLVFNPVRQHAVVLNVFFWVFLTIVQGVKTAAVAKSFREVSGYLGENITLPSGADPSWNLLRIEWSIFTNTTWIATYNNGEKNTRYIPQYAGRLTLSETSGNRKLITFLLQQYYSLISFMLFQFILSYRWSNYSPPEGKWCHGIHCKPPQ